jgi:hypothetical protein
MRKPRLLAVVVFVCACAASRAADPPAPGGIDSQLRDIAKSNPSVAARAAAIDMLGTRGAQEASLAPTMRSYLVEILDAPGIGPEQNYILLHVVQSLGQLGPVAKEALPNLARRKGLDSTLDSAIDTAVKAILKPPAATQDQPPKPPPAPPPGPGDALITTLGDDKADVLSRIIAAKALTTMAKTLTDDQKTKAKAAATTASGNADKDLKCVAGNTLDALK